MRKDVCRAGTGGKAWKVQSCSVTGAQHAAVGDNDGDAGIGWRFVGVGEICGDEVAGAAGVGNGKGARWGAGAGYRSGDR